MKILLTGPTGFVGSRTLDLLLKKNHDVYVLVHETERLEEFQHKGVHALAGNAEENGSWLAQIPSELDYIINTITPSVPARVSLKQIENEFAPLVFNIGKNLLYAASKTGCKHMYQLAEVHCYKNTGTAITEKSLLDRDSSNWGRVYMDLLPYLQSQKQTAISFFMHGFLYDSSGKTKPEIPILAGRLPIVGGGENYLTFSHVEDVASSLIFAVEKEFSGSMLNVVDDKAITQKEFINLLAIKIQTGTIPIPKMLANPAIGDILTNTLCESIQVKNDELKSLGYWLKFPDIKSGFAAGTI